MARFWKYHGLGNDFLLMDRRDAGDLEPAAVRRICARHTGVGADGILALLEGAGRPLMRVFNADGSVADMCGNGLRCFVAWLVDDVGMSPAELRIIDSDAGPQLCEVLGEAEPGVRQVRVDLGAPDIHGPLTVVLGEYEHTGVSLFLGNPHFVLRGQPADDRALEQEGRALARHEAFPRGTNVEWLNPSSRGSADVVVYERGVGPTQACGTGGAGASVVGVWRGWLDADVDLRVRQTGGELVYRVASDMSSVWMTGPAARVYEGELPL